MQQLTIVGLGLIGASLAKALAGRYHITGIDRDEETIRAALADGVIARGGGAYSLAARSDIVIIALPVGAIVPAARELLPHLKEGAIISDTGSTKASICRELGDHPLFVGGHPMAGTEYSGYGASFAELFDGAPCLLTPQTAAPQAAVDTLRRLWQTAGARVATVDAREHDGLMAIISHLPHLVSFAYMNLAPDLAKDADFFGKGFRDFTRIAASDPTMWRDIFLDNQDELLPLLDKLLAELSRWRELIADGEGEQLKERLHTAQQIRRNLYGPAR